MTASDWIIAILAFSLAAAAACIGVRQFAQKGFLFHNAYLYASKEERETMNKKPYYRQSAIVFCLLGTVFLVMGLSAVLQSPKVQLLEIPLICATVVYAVVSSVRMAKHDPKK